MCLYASSGHMGWLFKPHDNFSIPSRIGALFIIEHTAVADIPETSGFGLNDLNP